MNDDASSPQLGYDASDENGWPVPRLFLRYGREHRGLIAVALLASCTFPLLALLPVYLLHIAIDAILLNTGPIAPGGIHVSSVPGNRLIQLYLVAIAMGALALLAAALSALSSVAWGRFAQDVQHAVRLDAYARVQRLDLQFFDGQQTGQLLSILNSDIDALNRLLESFLRDLIEALTRFVGIAAILLVLHWELALFALVLFPLLGGLARYFVTHIRPLHQRVRERIGTLTARLENNLSGIEVIKAFVGEDYELARVARASRSVYRAHWAVITTQAKFFPTMSGVNWVGFACLLVLGGHWYLVGPPAMFTRDMSVGILVAFLLYNQQLTTPMMQTSHIIDLYYEARASVVRVFSLLETDVAIERSESATALTPVRGAIEVDDVTFAYGSSSTPALCDVSFAVPPGSFVGLVGPTGSGKTTLIRLLLRFYDPDEGTVRVDGHDVRTYDPARLRRAIGLVPQEPYLFSGTIAENVAYADSEASPQVIERALRDAHAWEFVERYPAGIDTSVGQRGVRLSGGQRQRIAIARAILAEPEILILDEATSHIDTGTEMKIQRAIREFGADRTTVAIAHRLSTIRHADHILVMADGRIVERGTHESLLAADGQYATLWRAQLGDHLGRPSPPGSSTGV